MLVKTVSRSCWEMFVFRAVHKGDYKLLWLPQPFGNSDWQLYDLSNDPGELNDLSVEELSLRRSMISYLAVLRQ